MTHGFVPQLGTITPDQPAARQQRDRVRLRRGAPGHGDGHPLGVRDVRRREWGGRGAQANVPVYLYLLGAQGNYTTLDADGNPVPLQTKSTNGNGEYFFDGLAGGGRTSSTEAPRTSSGTRSSTTTHRLRPRDGQRDRGRDGEREGDQVHHHPGARRRRPSTTTSSTTTCPSADAVPRARGSSPRAARTPGVRRGAGRDHRGYLGC